MSETIVQETLETTVRDGTVLQADEWRPSGGGKHPVLLIRLPSAIPTLDPGAPGGFFSDWLAHETKDEYWKRWDLTDKLSEVAVPTLVIGGLYDVFLESTVACCLERAHRVRSHGRRAGSAGTRNRSRCGHNDAPLT